MVIDYKEDVTVLAWAGATDHTKELANEWKICEDIDTCTRLRNIVSMAKRA